MVRRTDRPAMTIAVDLGRKTTKQTKNYLNLLVKPRIFFGFFGKNIILCILKDEL